MKRLMSFIGKTLFLLVVVGLISIPVQVQAATGTVKTTSDLTPQETYNLSLQHYWDWSDPVYSYLVSTDSGLMRVEYDYLTTDSVVVEYYNSSYSVTSKKYVTCELELFGGFYAGEDAYYLVFGQENSGASDSVEVLRIVKYSKSWKRLGAASIYGADTATPFYAGSLRMTEYGGYLYIRTSHEMYSGHQSNWTIEVDESTMKVVEETSDYLMNIISGYVSHSFNQFILVDDEANLLALDHGDAYPRSAVLFKYLTAAGNSSFGDFYSSGYSFSNNEYVELYEFSYDEDYYDNCTFATIGGFEYSSSSYIVAGSSVEQDEKPGSHTAYNIFITVTSRDDFSSAGTKTKWITSYEDDDEVDVLTPQLVKLGDDSFLLMWQTIEYLKKGWLTSDVYKVNYVFLDGKGNKTSKIYQETGYCSDCQPIVVDGKVVWYATKTPAPVFFTIDSAGKFTSIQLGLESPTLKSATSTVDGLKLVWTKTDGATRYAIEYADSAYNTGYIYTTGTSYTIPYDELSEGYYVLWIHAINGSEESLTWEKTLVKYKSVKLSTPSISSVKQSSKDR